MTLMLDGKDLYLSVIMSLIVGKKLKNKDLEKELPAMIASSFWGMFK